MVRGCVRGGAWGSGTGAAVNAVLPGNAPARKVDEVPGVQVVCAGALLCPGRARLRGARRRHEQGLTASGC